MTHVLDFRRHAKDSPVLIFGQHVETAPGCEVADKRWCATGDCSRPLCIACLKLQLTGRTMALSCSNAPVAVPISTKVPAENA